MTEGLEPIINAEMRVCVALGLLLVSLASAGQSLTIIGSAVNAEDSSALPCAYVALLRSGVTGTQSDFDGKFTLNVTRVEKDDTLQIVYTGFRRFFLLNLPTSSDTLFLGQIPMFECIVYSAKDDDFWADFPQYKWSQFKFKRTLKRVIEYTNYKNRLIEACRFRLNDKTYKLNYTSSLRYPTVTIDLSKPEQ